MGYILQNFGMSKFEERDSMTSTSVGWQLAPRLFVLTRK